MDKHCLICYQPVSPRARGIKRESEGESVIRNQLQVIFVLRELLRLPVEKVKQFLEQAEGDNLDKWISFCGNCEDEVERAREIFEELVKVNARFKGIREKLVGRVRGSWGKEGGNKVDRGGRRTRGRNQKKEEGITEETREFVVNYDYSSDPDSFVEIWGKLVQVKQEPEEPRDEDVEDEDNVDLDAFVNQLINEEDGGGDQEEDDKVPSPKLDFVGEASPDPDWQPEEDDSDLDEFQEDNLIKEAVKEKNSLVKGSNGGKPTTSSSKSSTVSKQKRPARNKKSLEDEGAFLFKGQIRYKCTVEDCGMILKSRRNYNRHKLRRHSGNKKGPEGHEAAFRNEAGQLRYKCPVEGCGKIVKQRHNYESHKLHVHEGVPYPPKEKLSLCCDQCGKAFETWGGLRAHRKRVHEGITEPQKVSEAAMKRKMEKIQCAHCPRMVSRCVMAHHVKIRHTEGFSHYCQICGQTAKSSKEFKSHQADKHGLCSMPECKLKVFGGREELWKHQVEVHGKEVDIFRCLDCGKCFTIKTRLGRHQKIHEYQKKVLEGGAGEGGRLEWVCDLCGKEFALSEYLYFHKWSKHKIRNAQGKIEHEIQ